MVVSIAYDQLAEALQKQLSEYSTALTEELNAAYKELADAGVDELKRVRPYHDRTGQYSKNFAVKQRKNAQSVVGAQSYTIHNKKRYQITHLLEHGHLTRDGKRKTQAFPHWEEAERKIESEAVRKIEEAVRTVNNQG